MEPETLFSSHQRFRLKALIGDALQEITICPCCEEAWQCKNLTGPGRLED
ncbi:hypothetical protein Pyn_03896 [Prunus yedoensis var. nudiflora]|uniref:Uncharacterized protein n=1 Tax=Prunus yedoensis var. nudiflora TaxID=2094558 RepID=A0A314UJW3_PRUYE|nr:hypothetical protein Pyn_03896 [Prunus yedoensis var. nudiflora]